MTAVWIGILVIAGATALFIWTSWRHRVDLADRGTVSQQWLSEHRLHDRHNSER
jgi:hypothetical protein